MSKISHCRQGHAYTPENTILLKNGARVCRTCKCAREKRNRALRSLGQAPQHNNGTITDEALRLKLALSGNERHLIALYRYGARNGGLPNISVNECRAWLIDAEIKEPSDKGIGGFPLERQALTATSTSWPTPTYLPTLARFDGEGA